MKHDFIYSARLFFALGAIAVALAFILGGFDALYQGQRIMLMGEEQSIIFSPLSSFMQLIFMLLIPVSVAAIIHIAQFYQKSMFGRAGHLSMTMPVSRGALLVSKLAVSYAWLLYAIAIGLIMVAITHIVSPYLDIANFFVFIDIGTIAFAINSAIFAFGAIALLFFCITLSHSIFAGKRLHGIFAGIIGLLCGGFFMHLANRLTSRFTPVTTELIARPDGTIWGENTIIHVPLTGLQYGRIVLGQRPWGGHDVYIDIFFIAFMLAAATIAVVATHALLKSRVSL